jgi:hypothetical protein
LLANNFGEMPKVSIAEPVNQYNKSMRQLQVDVELRAVLISLSRLNTTKGGKATMSQVAADLNWIDTNEKPDYRKARRIMELAEKQKLVDLSSDKKTFTINEAGRAYAAEEVSLSGGNQEKIKGTETREPGSDDE